MDTGVKITAKDVNQLRKMTGAGMMDCKKALVEAGGDFDAAIEYLRKKGQKVAAKRADRDATEGAAIAKVNDDHTKGVVIVLSCETDFVAKNEDFVQFANDIAAIALDCFPDSKEDLLEQTLASGETIADRLSSEVGKIGEKIEVSAYEKVKAETVVPYIHAGNKIGVLVALNQSGDEVNEAGKDVAMQIAAMRPVAVDESDVDEATRQKELEIGREQAIAEGKPEKIIERIAEGKLKKFYQENTLLNQKFVKDSSKTVRQFLQSIDKELTVTGFKRNGIG